MFSSTVMWAVAITGGFLVGRVINSLQSHLIRCLLNRGVRCHCECDLSKKYKLIELVTSLIFFIIILQFGWHGRTALLLLLVSGLMLLALIDSRCYLLPDCITLTLIWLGLLSNAYGLFVSAQQAIIGAVGGYLSLWLVAAIYKVWRKTEGIGRGDFKLLAVFGAWWGIYPLPMIVFLASVFGSVAGLFILLSRKHSFVTPLPFGPYLVAGGLITLLLSKWFFGELQGMEILKLL